MIGPIPAVVRVTPEGRQKPVEVIRIYKDDNGRLVIVTK